jgi:hypothetical protein
LTHLYQALERILGLDGPLINDNHHVVSVPSSIFSFDNVENDSFLPVANAKAVSRLK